MNMSDLMDEETLDGGYDDSGNMLIAETISVFTGVVIEFPEYIFD